MMVGDVLADRYELEELVGSGGMSSVYRAHDRVLDRRVALKILHQHFSGDDEYVRRFRREARTVAGLSHPNIVSVIDRGDHDHHQFIVFEYVEGETLKRLIERHGPSPVERALELGIEIARALAYAHERGLVHRDVKPQNVLLNGHGEAKVTDFGIARELDVRRGMTETGTVLGTSDYISPEQAQGLRVEEQTDVYSLGIVLYELLTGEVPFAGDNFVAVAMGHINEPAPDVLERRPDVPPRLAAAIARALAKEPSERWPSMAEFCRELELCLDGEPADEGNAQTVVLGPAAPRRRARRRRTVTTPRLLIAAGGVLLAVALAIALTRGGHGGPSRAAAITSSIQLAGVTAYDPYGNNHVEDNAAAPQATDGSMATYWSTEHYRATFAALDKPGVGLVLGGGNVVTLNHVTISTDTPGFTAKIQAGDSEGGQFHDVSALQTVSTRTTFDLNNATGRYFVIWITGLPPGSGVAHVNEVTAG